MKLTESSMTKGKTNTPIRNFDITVVECFPKSKV